MNDKSPQQRNEKKHRKLVRSPEKLSPCDFDPFYNPSLLSASTNVFINQYQTKTATTTTTNQNRSSPTKTYNDQFPPQSQQQIWISNESPNHQYIYHQHTSLPPSSSTPSIALHRKPSITIRTISKDDETIKSSPSPPSSLAHHQTISKSIDLDHPFMTSSTISSEMKDQMSNNFLINFPQCYDVTSSSKNQQQQQQQQQQYIIEKNLSPFNFNDEFTTNSSNIHHNQSSSISQSSLNLNLIANQQQVISDSICGSQIVFNSNNPFLSDNFDCITTDNGGNKKFDNFFNIDDSNDTELLFLSASDEVMTTTTTTTTTAVMKDENEEDLNQQDEHSLKNKREKFSNASPTMKICLVVSPPTNKTFQVSDCVLDWDI